MRNTDTYMHSQVLVQKQNFDDYKQKKNRKNDNKESNEKY